MSRVDGQDRAGRDCGLAVVCDRSGTILSVLEDRFCAPGDRVAGTNLAMLMASSSAEKTRAFLEQVYSLGSAFDWELALDAPDGVRVVTAAGVRQDDTLVVILAGSGDDAAKMFEQFISVNNELVNTIRALHKRLAAQGVPGPDGTHGFSELMRLNNDLVNLQREMSKKNAELAESRRLTQTIIDTTPDAIYILDLPGRRNTFISRGFERMLGYSDTQIAAYDGRVYEALLHDEDRAARDRHVEAITTLPDGDVLEWEYRLRASSGEWRWLRSRETVFERDASARPTRILGSARDITDVRAAEQELVRMTIIDGLTGLYNRRGLETLSRQSMAKARRESQTAGILFADVDGLKEINDTYGHAAGDDAIRDTARILSELSRASDVVARLGGDEFVVLTMPADEPGMESFRSRLSAEVARLNAEDSRPYRLEISMGYALCGDVGTCTLGEILRAADERMYLEKERRRRERFDD